MPEQAQHPGQAKDSRRQVYWTVEQESQLQLQLDSAVQQAVKATVDETVAALAKNGWSKP